MKNKCFDIKILYVISMCFIVLVVLLNFFSLGRYLNSDMYGDIWISKLMCEQKTFFPENWCFGNQVYILATPNIASLLYAISGNLYFSMSLASALMFLLTVIAFVYCFKACYSFNTTIIGLVVFFAMFICSGIPDNEFGQLFFTGTTFYSCYIITLLFTFGLYIRVLKGESVGNYCYTRDAVKAIITILLSGENGESYTVVNENSTMMIKDMAKLVAENFSAGKSKVVFDIPKDNMYGYAPDTKMCLSSEKLRKLGWEPEIDIIQMYARMIPYLY